MKTQKKVVSIVESPAMKRVVVPTEVPVACADVAAFVRALYEDEILRMIETIQEETCDD